MEGKLKSTMEQGAAIVQIWYKHGAFASSIKCIDSEYEIYNFLTTCKCMWLFQDLQLF